MASSRAVVVLGMHRSGTSALTRGLRALGIYLGNNFLDAKPDNPTGFWEDKTIFDLNERLLAVFGLKWEDVALIGDTQWQEPRVEALRVEALAYLQAHFTAHPLWGFKDPRTMRLLPFWRSVLQCLGMDDTYVVAIRNPLSVASSLLRRQGIRTATAHMLWLVHVVPYFSEIANRPFVVTDYDLLMDDPKGQIERIRRTLAIPLNAANPAETAHFTSDFLDPTLRHSHFSENDYDSIPYITPLTRESYLWSPLTREAYHWLYQLATDRITPDSSCFWSEWGKIHRGVEALMANGTHLG